MRPPDQYMSISESAEWVDVSYVTIWRHIKRGKLEHIRVGNRVRIDRATLIAYFTPAR